MPPTILTIILYFTLILFLAIKPVSSVTDLTYLNCPNDYEVTIANVTKPNDMIVKFFFSAFDNP